MKTETVMTTYQFSKSLQVAIDFLLNFQENNSRVVTNWKNFTWFEKIAPGEVRNVGEDVSNASRFNMLERQILFYGYKETLLACVYLEGNEFTNPDETKPTFWQVVKVDYVEDFDGSRIFATPELIEVEIKKESRVLI